MDGLKPWKCENGHVLGVVQRVRVKDGHVARLMLYRHAIDGGVNGAMEEVDVIACIEGTTLDVACDAAGCDKKRTWFIGEDALEAFIEARKAKVRSDEFIP